MFTKLCTYRFIDIIQILVIAFQGVHKFKLPPLFIKHLNVWDVKQFGLGLRFELWFYFYILLFSRDLASLKLVFVHKFKNAIFVLNFVVKSMFMMNIHNLVFPFEIDIILEGFRWYPLKILGDSITNFTSRISLLIKICGGLTKGEGVWGRRPSRGAVDIQNVQKFLLVII